MAMNHTITSTVTKDGAPYLKYTLEFSDVDQAQMEAANRAIAEALFEVGDHTGVAAGAKAKK